MGGRGGRAVEAVAGAFEVIRVKMVGQVGIVIADPGRLLGGEIAALAGGQSIQGSKELVGIALSHARYLRLF